MSNLYVLDKNQFKNETVGEIRTYILQYWYLRDIDDKVYENNEEDTK